MKLRTLGLAALAAVGACAGAGWLLWSRRDPPPPNWKTSPVTQRDVQKVVSSTGALTADPSIDVGTQVSGIVAELLVDFNDKVAAGQVLARIDPTLLEADVAAANARLSEATAHQGQVALELSRIEALHQKQAATDQELELSKANAAVADAQVRTAKVAVDRTRRNLDYATITAPVAGTIIKRSVTLGQTVNAGFSAPTLFSLAKDLEHMIILANVDESDVGLVHEGQTAKFTVQAWPDRTFVGTVRQVRMDAKLEQGVVTYTTVIAVDNPDGVLFPSMTATVEFIVSEAIGVLCAPNAALRFKPDAGTVTVGEVPEGSMASADAGTSGGGGGSGGSMSGGGRGGGSSRKKGGEPTSGVLWTPDQAALRAMTVKTGIRGSECTEVSAEGLVADTEVVLGVDRSADVKTASPFSTKGAAGPGKPGGF